MNQTKLIYTLKAEKYLETIVEYIAQDSIKNALSYIDKIESAIDELATSPYLGFHCHSKGIARDCRILIVENHLIFYQYNKRDNEVKIIRFIHGSRKYKQLLEN